MNLELKNQYLNEAIRIGDELISFSETDEYGCSWQTITIDEDKKPIWHKAESIYTGMAGIVLFFIELFKQTQDKKYLNIVIDGVHWLEHFIDTHRNEFYSLYTGRMGVSFTLLKVYDLLNEDRYLDKALAIIKTGKSFMEFEGTVNDLINGKAGTLLGLLHLYTRSQDEWLFEAIQRYVAQIVKEAQIGPNGCYWDRSQHHVRGLCGLSHGAAGIGFVLLELGHFFQDESFYWLAEQALLYESNFLNKSKKNWPDFRLGLYSDEDYAKYERFFLDGKIDEFLKAGDMNAWCHGAAGIGLSRLRAYELLKKQTYREDIDIAIEKTIATEINYGSIKQFPTFTLCHGGGGNAELFLEAFRVLKDDKYLALAEDVANQCLDFKQKNKVYISGYAMAGKLEDRSLFLGNAGIGYFLLRLIDPENVPSIQLPILQSIERNDSISHPSPIITTSQIRRNLSNHYFSRTLFVLEKSLPHITGHYFQEIDSALNDNEMNNLVNFLKNLIATLPAESQVVIEEIFNFELTRMEMDQAVVSNVMLNIKERVKSKHAAKLVNLAEEMFLHTQLILEPDIKLEMSQWNWIRVTPEKLLENLTIDPCEYPYLAKPTPKGILEEKLSHFSFTVLELFLNGDVVQIAINKFMDIIEPESPDEEKAIRQAVIQQIKQAIYSGILIEDNASFKQRCLK